MVTIEDLEKACNNNTLNEVISLLDSKELFHLYTSMLPNDIVGVREVICNAIWAELDKRENDDLAFHMFNSKK